ncbi:glycine-rich protein-like [Macrobrachium rosenbergii]|uniref:glycine-rich protein-like n=1 Tax=Macrobrachium rosenbergii TaxID=79674 RepID=UPI0034D62C2B
MRSLIAVLLVALVADASPTGIGYGGLGGGLGGSLGFNGGFGGGFGGYGGPLGTGYDANGYSHAKGHNHFGGGFKGLGGLGTGHLLGKRSADPEPGLLGGLGYGGLGLGGLGLGLNGGFGGGYGGYGGLLSAGNYANGYSHSNGYSHGNHPQRFRRFRWAETRPS